MSDTSWQHYFPFQKDDYFNIDLKGSRYFIPFRIHGFGEVIDISETELAFQMNIPFQRVRGKEIGPSSILIEITSNSETEHHFIRLMIDDEIKLVDDHLEIISRPTRRQRTINPSVNNNEGEDVIFVLIGGNISGEAQIKNIEGLELIQKSDVLNIHKRERPALANNRSEEARQE